MEQKKNKDITLSDIMDKIEATKSSLEKAILTNRKSIEENEKSITLVGEVTSEIYEELKEHRAAVPELIESLADQIENLLRSSTFKNTVSEAIIRSEDSLEIRLEKNYGLRINDLEVSTEKIKKKVGMK